MVISCYQRLTWTNLLVAITAFAFVSGCQHTVPEPDYLLLDYRVSQAEKKFIDHTASLITPKLIETMPHLKFLSGNLLLSTPNAQVIVAGIPSEHVAREQHPIILGYFEYRKGNWITKKGVSPVLLHSNLPFKSPQSFQLHQENHKPAAIELIFNQQARLRISSDLKSPNTFHLDWTDTQKGSESFTSTPRLLKLGTAAPFIPDGGSPEFETLIVANTDPLPAVLQLTNKSQQKGEQLPHHYSATLYIGLRGLLTADRSLKADQEPLLDVALRLDSDINGRDQTKPTSQPIVLASGLSFQLPELSEVRLSLSRSQLDWLQSSYSITTKAQSDELLVKIKPKPQAPKTTGEPATEAWPVQKRLPLAQAIIALLSSDHPLNAKQPSRDVKLADVVIEDLSYDLAIFIDPSLGLELLSISEAGRFNRIAEQWQNYPFRRGQTWSQRLATFLKESYPQAKRELLCPDIWVSPIELEQFAITLQVTDLNLIDCQSERFGDLLLASSNRIQSASERQVLLSHSYRNTKRSMNSVIENVPSQPYVSNELLQQIDLSIDSSTALLQLALRADTWQQLHWRSGTLRWVMIASSRSNNAIRIEDIALPNECFNEGCQVTRELTSDIRFVRVELIGYNEDESAAEPRILGTSQFIKNNASP